MKNSKFFSAIIMIAICGLAISCKPAPEPPVVETPPLVATWKSASQNEIELVTTSANDQILQTYKSSILDYVNLPESFTFKADGTGAYVLNGATGSFTYVNTAAAITVTAQNLLIGAYNMSGKPLVLNYALESDNSVLKIEYDATAAAKASLSLVPTLADYVDIAEITLVKIKAAYNKFVAMPD